MTEDEALSLCNGDVIEVVTHHSWGWWQSHVGEHFKVLCYREQYSDVLIEDGNAIDIECIRKVKSWNE